MAGSMIEFSIKGRSFKCSADADGSTMLGGRSNEFKPSGDGITGKITQTMKGWKFSGISFNIDDESGDLEFLQDVADSGKLVPMKGVYSDGTVRSGQGTITGDLEVSSMSGTASVTIEGPGKFQIQ